MDRTTEPKRQPPLTDNERAERILKAISRLQRIQHRRNWAGVYWLLAILLLVSVLLAVASVGRQFRQYWQQLVSPQETTSPASHP